MLEGQREGRRFYLIWWLTSNRDNPYFYNDTYREHRDGEGTSAFGNFSTRAVGTEGEGGNLPPPQYFGRIRNKTCLLKYTADVLSVKNTDYF